MEVLKNKHLTSRSVTYIFAGLILINICANYISGSTGIYAATAFREYDRIDLLSILFVIEPLTRSAALLISGSAGEYFGRKKLYLWSVGAYAFSIFLCALSPDGFLFLIAQGASGFFWGLFFSNVFSILNDVVPEKEYPVRLATLQTVNFSVLIIGPVICGLLTEYWNWRVSLFALCPLFAAGLAFIWFFMPDFNQRKFSEAQYAPQNILKDLQISVLLKHRGFLIVSLITFVFTCITCSGKYIPLYAQTALNSSATISALILLPCNLLGMLTAGLSGWYIKKKGCSKRFMLVMAGAGFMGTLFYAGMIFFTNYSIVILSTAIIGIGLGIYQVAPFAYAQAYMGEQLIAKGTAFIGFIQGAASVLGGVVFSLTIGKGVAFALATTFIYGVVLLWITVFHYKEPAKLNVLHHEPYERQEQ
ncbi:MFS transporter [Paenibacillus sonchi]|uniref:MFS transporter n=1 Tax=Paenibacillus sonchi TaxID=373687 RepID=A0A974P9F2_9BACL|nr:MFS transporter [Paenibacillus sonchi]QQZ59331.1 MFS transporter [Paenibacillus sonchi]